MNKHFLVLIIFLIIRILAFSQKKDIGKTLNELQKSQSFNECLNWQNLDPEKDHIMGTSVDRAYQELLKGKKAKKTIVVAVIDDGVDIKHEDLKEQIWVNKDEIPNNGIDDDHNGYIDDINGWNFIGNSKGENLIFSHTEATRWVRKYKSQFKEIKSIDSLTPKMQKKYKQYQLQLHVFNIKRRFHQLWGNILLSEQKKINENLLVLSNYIDKNGNILIEDLKNLKLKDELEKKARQTLLKMYKKSTKNIIEKNANEQQIKEEVEPYLKYSFNPEWDERELIGDNPDDLSDMFYGNNIVDGNGYGCSHGTFVSGLIAANRNNGIGINGIAQDVKIMVLRVVPNGDEHDKDVALAIKYAIDNGAQIINMSFGKYYSDKKYMVDKILKEAKDKKVLIFHAAGNEGLNNDITKHHPTPYPLNGKVFEKWISVGASNRHNNKHLKASFSNYGKKHVDFFAPGIDLISISPQNTYKKANGTSFSCPISTGVAALIWSYYPELSAKELKEILLQSVTHSKKRVSKPMRYGFFKRRPKFSQLSVTGGVVNAYKALLMAQEKAN